MAAWSMFFPWQITEAQESRGETGMDRSSKLAQGTTYPCFKGQISHLTQFLTSEAEKHMPPAVVAGTAKSHAKGCGCVILTQGGSKESEQQIRHHSISHWGTPFLMSAAG